MIRAGEVVFVDTNVLLTATDSSRTGHDTARQLCQGAAQAGYHLAISGQIVREYLVVATRPVEANGLGMRPEQALHNVDALTRPPTVFCDEPEAVAQRVLALVRAYDLHGKRVHDANVAATMHVHGIQRLITDNGQDFAVFPEVDVASIEDLRRAARHTP